MTTAPRHVLYLECGVDRPPHVVRLFSGRPQRRQSYSCCLIELYDVISGPGPVVGTVVSSGSSGSGDDDTNTISSSGKLCDCDPILRTARRIRWQIDYRTNGRRSRNGQRNSFDDTPLVCECREYRITLPVNGQFDSHALKRNYGLGGIHDNSGTQWDIGILANSYAKQIV